MAIRSSENAFGMLRTPLAKTAAAVCAVLALVPAAALTWLLWAHPAQRTEMQFYLGGWIVVFCLVAANGMGLARGGMVAQRFLLAFWLLAALASLLALLSGLLWGWDWWPAPTSLPASAGALLAAAVIAASLLVLCSVPRSRLRYASYVTVSVAVAVGLVIVCNMIAQTEYYRRDVQTLHRYGLSGKTRVILQALKTPVRLTCVYTSADEKTLAADYRPAVLELLEEMRQANPLIEVANAATDSAKAKVVGRLRGQLGVQVKQHTEFLQDFQRRGEALNKAVGAEAEMWKALGEDSYLGLWGLPAEVLGVLGKTSQETDQLRSRIAREMAASALPNFTGIIDGVVQSFSGDRDTLIARARELEQIAKIPQAAAANQASALEAMDQCAKAVEAMSKTAGASTQATDQSVVLVKFIVSARNAIQKTLAAAKALGNIAGPANAEIVRSSRRFRRTFRYDDLEVRTDLAAFLEKEVAKPLEDMSRELEGVKKVAKPEYYGQAIKQMAALADEINREVAQVKNWADEAVQSIVKVDEPSQKILNPAAGKGALQGVVDILKSFVADAQKLPPLENDTLTKDIVSDNIVIVESGNKAGVVRFDETWPVKARVAESADVQAKEQRVFNGDAAISSKMLAMTSEPFATVLLTYFAPVPEAAAVLPPADIGLEDLAALRKRLEEANFEVRDWNLSEAMPVENRDRPAVMLVLPPPPSVPISPKAPPNWKSFSQEHVDKVRRAIDAGVPAIFLAVFQPPRQLAAQMPPLQLPYGFGDYLSKEWGIDVKTEYLVVPAVPDEMLPGRYKVDSQRFAFLPLSTFADHPIGTPLQAQRVLWTRLSPILRGQPIPGVSVWSLLSVPENWTSTWATNRLKELVSQFQTGEGSYIWPDYSAGDIKAPFDVAVAAVRRGQAASRPSSYPATTPATSTAPASKPARIVVLALAAGLVDGYLDQRVGQLDAKGAVSLADPPRANADVAVNSVFWLTGRESRIAAGPVQIKPVELISPNVLAWIRGLCLAGLPLAAAAIGVVVLLVRRR